jgi:hypothetical protein
MLWSLLRKAPVIGLFRKKGSEPAHESANERVLQLAPQVLNRFSHPDLRAPDIDMVAYLFAGVNHARFSSYP